MFWKVQGLVAHSTHVDCAVNLPWHLTKQNKLYWMIRPIHAGLVANRPVALIWCIHKLNPLLIHAAANKNRRAPLYRMNHKEKFASPILHRRSSGKLSKQKRHGTEGRNFLPFLVDELRANTIYSPEFASRHHAGLKAVAPALLLTEIVTAKSLVVGICVVLLVRKASEWSDPED